jgi:ABC-type branched-subunit amino acid transport system substrate-binding protein|tara:strand:- start:126 stop:494 length:369 start_codon:yes stop_codon:yes gene_type:complete
MRLRELIEDGRIIKGVNTTVDVSTDEIKTQTAKFGNTVDKDGRPPTLSKKVKGSSTNVLFNLGMTENFADGKKKGKSRPGRVKKSGASCNGTVTQLRKRAKNASGEKAKMYHWCANMKSGKK